MLTWLLIIILLILALITPFISTSLSPIPYFPTNKNDIGKIKKLILSEQREIVIDLGAGNGTVIFSLATDAYKQKLKTKFMAVEINPILVLILHLRRLLNPNRSNIIIRQKDMFKMDYSKFSTYRKPLFYIYISPWFIEKVIKKIRNSLNAFTLVSYMYPLKSEKPKKVIRGVNNIHEYVLT